MPREYLIEFDIMDGHRPQTGATLVEAMLKPTGWRSIGSPSGGQFVNKTGVTITSVYLKANNQGDTLKITDASAGRLFKTVWVKTDGTEVYFKDGNIPVFDGTRPSIGVFWMRVPRNSSSDIAKCDSGGGCPFTGQLFKDPPPDPTGAGWTKLAANLEGVNEKWLALMAAAPSEFRDIQVYGESADGRYVAFISDGELFLYDDGKRAVSILTMRQTSLSTVNHIAIESGQITLYHNGTVLQKIGSEPATFRSLS